eukprot:jgi/Bigna1/83966/fgenesh1_pg.119_\
MSCRFKETSSQFSLNLQLQIEAVQLDENSPSVTLGGDSAYDTHSPLSTTPANSERKFKTEPSSPDHRVRAVIDEEEVGGNLQEWTEEDHDTLEKLITATESKIEEAKAAVKVAQEQSRLQKPSAHAPTGESKDDRNTSTSTKDRNQEKEEQSIDNDTLPAITSGNPKANESLNSDEHARHDGGHGEFGAFNRKKKKRPASSYLELAVETITQLLSTCEVPEAKISLVVALCFFAWNCYSILKVALKCQWLVFCLAIWVVAHYSETQFRNPGRLSCLKGCVFKIESSFQLRVAAAERDKQWKNVQDSVSEFQVKLKTLRDELKGKNTSASNSSSPSSSSKEKSESSTNATTTTTAATTSNSTKGAADGNAAVLGEEKHGGGATCENADSGQERDIEKGDIKMAIQGKPAGKPVGNLSPKCSQNNSGATNSSQPAGGASGGKGGGEGGDNSHHSAAGNTQKLLMELLLNDTRKVAENVLEVVKKWRKAEEEGERFKLPTWISILPGAQLLNLAHAATRNSSLKNVKAQADKHPCMLTSEEDDETTSLSVARTAKHKDRNKGKQCDPRRTLAGCEKPAALENSERGGSAIKNGTRNRSSLSKGKAQHGRHREGADESAARKVEVLVNLIVTAVREDQRVNGARASQ